MTGLRSDLEDDIRRFTDLLGWVDHVFTLLGASLVIVLVLTWWLR
jgi:hypothetical protein